MIMRYKSTPQARPDPTRHDKIGDIYSVKQSGTLLDVGCSAGDFLHLVENFYEVNGVKINPATTKIIKCEFTTYSDGLSNLNFIQRYDVVTLNKVFYNGTQTHILT